MIPNLPEWISVSFGITTFITVFLFYEASKRNTFVLLTILSLMLIQSILALSGFYLVEQTIPPRFALMLLPSVVLILLLFLINPGRLLIDSLDLRILTYIHVVRIPVEFVLWSLFLNGVVPELMTFEGRNFDIIAGITAPIVYYLYFKKRKMSQGLLLGWNILSLGLLMNIIIHGILSAPSFFQQFAFDQPNIAVLHFPFVWLPSIVVPIVMLSHFVGIVKLKSS